MFEIQFKFRAQSCNVVNVSIRIEVISCLSDHDIVYAEIDILPVRNHQKPRQIPLYSKAKW